MVGKNKEVQRFKRGRLYHLIHTPFLHHETVMIFCKKSEEFNVYKFKLVASHCPEDYSPIRSLIQTISVCNMSEIEVRLIPNDELILFSGFKYKSPLWDTFFMPKVPKRKRSAHRSWKAHETLRTPT